MYQYIHFNSRRRHAMQVMKRVLAVIAGVLVCACLAYGDDDVNVKLTPSGYASYQIGQVVHADSLTALQAVNIPQVDNILFQQMFVGLNLQGTFSPLPITTNIGLEMKALTEVPRSFQTMQDQGMASRLFYFFYLTRADLVYSQSKAFNLDVGYFPVKYNDDARDLGEYLFRTGTYPQYIITNFDFAAARVTGLNAYGTLFDNLNYKALLTINTENATMGDLNLTGIVSYSLPNKFLEVGGGVSFCSFISANINRTRPGLSVLQIGNNTRDEYVDKNGDTATYTFAGTKLMGRFSINPQSLFPNNLFGKDDFKLYAEAAVLGVKDYPVSVDTSSLGTRYNDIFKRLPIMFGFNIPTLKFLDVLNMEWEWFGSVYPNDMTTFVKDGLPNAISNTWHNIGTYADSTNDNWKWSIYAKKTLAKHFNIVFQVASDHYRWDCSAEYSKQANLLSEALTQMNQYYYVLKFGYNF